MTSEDLFAGKTVVVFSLPGAFTQPARLRMCHGSINQLATAFKSHGVDDIICISLSGSTFVMNEWRQAKRPTTSHLYPRWQWRVHRRHGYVGG
ncbi:MAG: redoxin family protein [Candidatus Competibacteraceae bacterium]